MRTNESLPLSPSAVARIAGGFYIVNIVTSLLAFSGKGNHWLTTASGWAATASYLAVTALLYILFRPASRSLSLVAALFSAAGCLVGLQLFRFPLNSLVFFGCYCLLLAFLILRSRLLPRLIGILMAIAGVGWLTFVSAPLAKALVPYPYIAGGVGEGLFTLWLLIAGVDDERWHRLAGATPAKAAVKV